MLWKKITPILTRMKCSKWLDTLYIKLFGCADSNGTGFWGCTFRCFWVMGYMYALSWKLLIIGWLLEYFAALLKILHLKKIARKCSIFLHQLHFSMGRDFQVIWNSSFWSKTTLCIFRKQIQLPNRKCYGKNKLYFDSLSTERSSLSTFLSQHLMQVINCKGIALYVQG